MATLAESLTSASSRRLPIRVRPDLRARRQRYQGRSYWVVKDPVALQYYRFEEEEFAILQMLDGESSLDQIAEQFEAEFPPQTIRTEELQQFIGMLHRSGLVLADAAGQGEQLKKRRDERKRKERMAMATNVLSIRFKGFDPERLLNALYAFPPIRWFFSWPVFIACMLFCLAALTLVLVNFDTFQSRLPSFQAYFAAQNWTNWLLLGVVLSVTKVLHEFGHGLSCKHFGGECHEMGVMFLVLTPCLYCNVSDSWMLPSRWKRAAIGAAGMYVEVVLAAFCTFIWWFTDNDTLLNKLCLNVMFISSVSTILFNANPLLRYDGYYILSDLMEVPNLRQKAQQILSRKLQKWCLGLDPPEDPFLPKRNQAWFAVYTVASAVYRWVVVLSICYFLNLVFEPYGLKVLGQLIALTAIWGLLGQPLWKVYKFMKVPGRLNKVKRWRMWATAGVVVAVVAAVVMIPLPAAVHCSALVQPRDAETVYVLAPGVLEEVFVEAGQRVEQGQPLARLSNIDTALTIARLESQIAEYEIRLADLKAMSFTDSGAAEQSAQVAELLATTQEQLVQYQKDARRLTLTAPVAGVIIPPPANDQPQADDRELPSWTGTPLDEKNLGATLEHTTVFCRIGDPERLEVRMAVEQSDIDDVWPGYEVEVMLNQSADFVYRGVVESRSTEPIKATPAQLSSLSGGDLATEVDESGVARPLSPHYDAKAALIASPDMSRSARDAHNLLRVGLTGRAKIHVRDKTLGQRLYRYLARTFNFEL